MAAHQQYIEYLASESLEDVVGHTNLRFLDIIKGDIERGVAAKFSANTSLTILRLPDMPRSAASALHSCAHLRCLSVSFGDGVSELVRKSSQLAFLSVGDCLDDSAWHVVAHSSSLTQLRTESITAKRLAELANCKSLSALHLDGGEGLHAGFDALAKSCALTALHLENVDTVPRSALTALLPATALTYISLRRCAVTLEGAEALGTLPALRTLSVLLPEDRNAVVTSGVVKALVQSQTITSLSLRACALENLSAILLAGDTVLRVLDIAENPGICDSGAVALSRNLHLTDLDLTDADLGEEAINELAFSNRGLTSLAVGLRNGPTDANYAPLTRNSRLHILRLTGSSVNDDTLRGLVTNNTLLELHLVNTKVTRDGMHRAMQLPSLPQLKLFAFDKSLVNQITPPSVFQRIADLQVMEVRERNAFLRICITLTQLSLCVCKLPYELRSLILLEFVCGSPSYARAMGKAPEQLQNCLKFLLENHAALRSAIRRAVAEKGVWSIVEIHINTPFTGGMGTYLPFRFEEGKFDVTSISSVYCK